MTWTTRHPVFGTPLPIDVLRHNAYTLGWEHGATDARVSRTEQPEIEALQKIYRQGYLDGAAARGKAFQTARELREVPDAVG